MNVYYVKKVGDGEDEHWIVYRFATRSGTKLLSKHTVVLDRFPTKEEADEDAAAANALFLHFFSGALQGTATSGVEGEFIARRAYCIALAAVEVFSK